MHATLARFQNHLDDLTSTYQACRDSRALSVGVLGCLAPLCEELGSEGFGCLGARGLPRTEVRPPFPVPGARDLSPENDGGLMGTGRLEANGNDELGGAFSGGNGGISDAEQREADARERESESKRCRSDAERRETDSRGCRLDGREGESDGGNGREGGSDGGNGRGGESAGGNCREGGSDGGDGREGESDGGGSEEPVAYVPRTRSGRKSTAPPAWWMVVDQEKCIKERAAKRKAAETVRKQESASEGRPKSALGSEVAVEKTVVETVVETAVETVVETVGETAVEMAGEVAEFDLEEEERR